MKFYFFAEGICRSASYTKDNAKKRFVCNGNHFVEEGKEKEMNDCINVVVKNSETKDQLRESWMVMHGTPAEIVYHMDNEWPMSKLESDMIFDYLDTVGKDDVVTLTYLLNEPSSLIKKTAMYREARICQQIIVAHLFGLNQEEIKVLTRSEE